MATVEAAYDRAVDKGGDLNFSGLMRRILAIQGLTIKAAFRYRLVTVLACLLIGAMIFLPMVVKDDQTARGLIQILLTYSLAVTITLLGFSTLWLACGTLAREVEECQLQVVDVKPVARWQVWLGKWLGIMTLNAILMTVAGAVLYGLIQWRSGQLSPEQKTILRNEVLVARSAAREPMPDIEADVQRVLKARLEENPSAPEDRVFLEGQIREQLRAQHQIVPPGFMRRWRVDLGIARHSVVDRPIYLRVRFIVPPDASNPDAPTTWPLLWEIGPPETANRQRIINHLSAESFHEFEVRPNLMDEDGTITVDLQNRTNTALLFPLEDGLEVLYREAGFGVNFVRGLGVILCWLGLLAALGLAASSFLSFPVAAFFSLGVLLVAFSGGTISSVVEENSLSGYTQGAPPTRFIDPVAVPLFKGILGTIQMVQQFSPVDSLSTGRSVTWLMLLKAVAQIVLLLGGLFAAFGMFMFHRRELAAAQNQG